MTSDAVTAVVGYLVCEMHSTSKPVCFADLETWSEESTSNAAKVSLTLRISALTADSAASLAWDKHSVLSTRHVFRDVPTLFYKSVCLPGTGDQCLCRKGKRKGSVSARPQKTAPFQQIQLLESHLHAVTHKSWPPELHEQTHSFQPNSQA